jgi:hypothetical protein
MAPKKKAKVEKVIETDSNGTFEVEESEFPSNVATAIKEDALCFNYDCWIYSHDHEPMILKKGTPMPKGYQPTPRFDDIYWHHSDVNGNWERVKK